MSDIEKLGTQIQLADGRKGTVVFNGLIGVGVKWGLHDPDPADFNGTTGGLFNDTVPNDWPWEPDALLRDPWDGCERSGWSREQCVGYPEEILRVGLKAENE